MTGPERRRRVEELCDAALDHDARERAAFVAAACGADEALRHEVEALLVHAQTADRFLVTPMGQVAAHVLGDARGGSLVGRQVGSYTILSLLGAGGMGDVYRARDTKLGRDVAIKVVADAFLSDPERHARFEREARVLAALNHPNIATIHGVEESPSTGPGQPPIRALVMELVEGKTLAEQLTDVGRVPPSKGEGMRGGPAGIPINEALTIAKQIADALEAAHEKGIIHRDLKPANIKISPAGVVKVLDFGLAKIYSGHAAGSDLSQSPSITIGGTREGVILGTAAYMSPEQARGQPIDKRTDIWAFGCVLYEMLTGRVAFAGDTTSDTIARVLERNPDWQALPEATPAPVTRLLQRCLDKDLKRRLHDIADARIEIEDVLSSASRTPSETAVVDSRRRPVRLLWSLAAVASLVALVAVGVLMWYVRTAPQAQTAPPLVSRFDYLLPEGRQFRGTGHPVMAVSPDGRWFVYNSTGGLYVRAMRELAARLVPGTEGGLTNPTFSPDGQWIAYYQESQLKRITISGGAPVVICAATNPFGVSWEADNTILFGQPEGIMRVSANGGTPELVIRAEKGEQMHGPQALPDGESVLFSVTRANGRTRWDQAEIVVQSLRTDQRTVVLKGGSDARYVPTGHLVYALEDGLFAIALDANRREVRGGPVSVIEGVRRATGSQATTAAANYGISNHGTLVYATSGAGADVQRTLVWVDRAGHEEVIPAPARAYQYPRVSPDGTRLALDIRDQDDDIWIWDLARQTLTRLTFDPLTDSYPVWSPDSQRLVFGSTRSGPSNLYWQAADGTGAVERLTESRNPQFPYAVTPDGNAILFREDTSASPDRPDLMLLLMPSPLRPAAPGVSKTPTPLVQTMFAERNAELAPKGQWLAYESNESGRLEIYVRPFPDVGSGRWQVSTSGGRGPLWARSGDELFYGAPDGSIQSVRVDGASSWRSSTPTTVLQGDYYPSTPVNIGRPFDIAPDGKRFLMIRAGSGDAPRAPDRLIVVENWFEELKRLVPTK